MPGSTRLMSLMVLPIAYSSFQAGMTIRMPEGGLLPMMCNHSNRRRDPGAELPGAANHGSVRLRQATVVAARGPRRRVRDAPGRHRRRCDRGEGDAGSLSASTLGAVAVEHNPLYTAEELQPQFEDHGAAVAVVWDKVAPVVAGLGVSSLQTVLAVDLTRALPGRMPRIGLSPRTTGC